MERQGLNYQDSSLPISFIENMNDPPDGYDVQLKEEYFYLPSRCLNELIRPSLSTSGLIRKLTTLNGLVPTLLKNANINPEQLHVAFLKLGLLRTENERDYFIHKAIK
jgi:hypothetical protein